MTLSVHLKPSGYGEEILECCLLSYSLVHLAIPRHVGLEFHSQIPCGVFHFESVAFQTTCETHNSIENNFSTTVIVLSDS